MDKPSIDELLENVPGGIYELATIAAKRAAWIKKKAKGNTQPLQQALEEIKNGKVLYKYRFNETPHEGQQIELDLDLEEEKIEFDASASLADTVAILEDPDELDAIDEEDDEDDEKLKQKDSDDLGVTIDEDDLTETIQKDQDYDDSDYD